MNRLILAALNIVDPNSLPHSSHDPDQTTLNHIFAVLWVTIGAVGVMLLVLAGLRYVVAGSTEDRITKAKNMVSYTIIGIIIASTASLLVKVVINMLGK